MGEKDDQGARPHLLTLDGLPSSWNPTCQTSLVLADLGFCGTSSWCLKRYMTHSWCSVTSVFPKRTLLMDFPSQLVISTSFVAQVKNVRSFATPLFLSHSTSKLSENTTGLALKIYYKIGSLLTSCTAIILTWATIIFCSVTTYCDLNVCLLPPNSYVEA